LASYSTCETARHWKHSGSSMAATCTSRVAREIGQTEIASPCALRNSRLLHSQMFSEYREKDTRSLLHVLARIWQGDSCDQDGENLSCQWQPGGAAAEGIPVQDAGGFHPHRGRRSHPFAATCGLVELSRVCAGRLARFHGGCRKVGLRGRDIHLQPFQGQ